MDRLPLLTFRPMVGTQSGRAPQPHRRVLGAGGVPEGHRVRMWRWPGRAGRTRCWIRHNAHRLSTGSSEELGSTHREVEGEVPEERSSSGPLS